jgi:hypothetical protein
VIAFQASADVLAGGPGGFRAAVLAVLLGGLLGGLMTERWRGFTIAEVPAEDARDVHVITA